MSVKEALKSFLVDLESEGAKIDDSNLNLSELEESIKEEYDCGFEGSQKEAIMELYETVGLEEFGIKIS